MAFQGFNTQPPEGGWLTAASKKYSDIVFQHTAARRRLACIGSAVGLRPGFNTQPPEGGWFCASSQSPAPDCFNTQPPEGGWNPAW